MTSSAKLYGPKNQRAALHEGISTVLVVILRVQWFCYLLVVMVFSQIRTLTQLGQQEQVAGHGMAWSVANKVA